MRALILRSTFATKSEPFIVAQAAGLTSYEPSFVSLDARSPFEDHPDFDWISLGSRTGRRLRKLELAHSGALSHQLLRERRPDVVHVHFGTDAALFRRSLKRLGVGSAATFHGYDCFESDCRLLRGSLEERLWALDRKAVFDAYDALIAVSQTVKDRLLALGAPEEKVIVHHIGVDTSLFAPSHPRMCVPPRIVFIGRLVPQKGASTLIEAVSRLRATLPNLELHIVGDGPDRLTLERQAAQCGGATFHGFLTPELARNVLQQATVAAVPSVPLSSGWIEAFGLTAIEAQAASVPVVASRLGGLAEAVEDGVTGSLVAPGDADALGIALRKYLVDPDRARRTGAAGRARTLREFDLQRQTAKLEEIYDKLQSRPPVRTGSR